jgi:hypothetical protein
MTKNRKNTLPILIDIKFNGSMNQFEEMYGDHVKYSEIEQESYIDLKGMIFEKINPTIKIRKFNREKQTLTLKADMLDKEYQLIQDILNEKIINIKATTNKELNPEGKIIKEKFNFLHNFIISKIKIMTQEDLIKAKKGGTVDPESGEDDYKLVEVSLDDIDGVEEVEDNGYEEDED